MFLSLKVEGDTRVPSSLPFIVPKKRALQHFSEKFTGKFNSLNPPKSTVKNLMYNLKKLIYFDNYDFIAVAEKNNNVFQTNTKSY
jgi:hypothetical protein